MSQTIGTFCYTGLLYVRTIVDMSATQYILCVLYTIHTVSGDGGQFIGFTQQKIIKINIIWLCLCHQYKHNEFSTTAHFEMMINWIVFSLQFWDHFKIRKSYQPESQYEIHIYLCIKFNKFKWFFLVPLFFRFSRQNNNNNKNNNRNKEEQQLTVNMCVRCHPQSRKYWVFGCGTFFMLLAIVVGLLWPIIAKYALRSVSIEWNKLIF